MKVTSKLQYEFFCNAVDLFNFARELCDQGVFDRCVLGEVWRRPEMQRTLKDRGYTKTLYGRHMDKLAFDMFFWYEGKFVKNAPKNKLLLQDVGDYWESRHPDNAWGGNWYKKPGDFLDLNHYEQDYLMHQ